MWLFSFGINLSLFSRSYKQLKTEKMKKFIVILLFTAFAFQSCAVRVVERNRAGVVIVKKAPRNRKIVVIKKKRYYTWGGNYYRKTSKGYVLVRV